MDVKQEYALILQQVLSTNVLRVSAKRYAIDDMSSRTCKTIRTELQSMTEESLVPRDIKSVAKAVYRKRCKNYPPLSKSHEETYINISKMNILKNKAERFLAVNDAENNVMIFICHINIECLYDADEVFKDGTFMCYPKFFQQMYTIQG
jgi:hypothetical protein